MSERQTSTEARYVEKTKGWNLPETLLENIIKGEVIPFRIHQIRQWLPAIYSLAATNPQEPLKVIQKLQTLEGQLDDVTLKQITTRANRVAEGIAGGNNKEKILDRIGSTAAQRTAFEGGIVTQLQRLLEASAKTKIIVGEIFSLVCNECAVGAHCYDLKPSNNEDHDLVNELKESLDRLKIPYEEVDIPRGEFDGKPYMSKTLVVTKNVFLAIVMSRMIAGEALSAKLGIEKYSLIPQQFLEMRASTFHNVEEDVLVKIFNPD